MANTGRASYRVEILFKRQKWHPKLADPKSKTFKDFATGLVVTVLCLFLCLNCLSSLGNIYVIWKVVKEQCPHNDTVRN